MTYNCTVCGKPFNKKRFMKSHRTQKHSYKYSTEIDKKDYIQCSGCNSYFEGKKGLFVHITNSHRDSELYEEASELMSGEDNPMYNKEFSEEHVNKILENRTHFWNTKGNQKRKEELKKEVSERTKEMYSKGEHPMQKQENIEKMLSERGEEWKENLSKTMKKKDNSSFPLSNDEVLEKAMENLGRRREVEETGHTVASSWEKEVDLMLHHSDFDYEYEPKFEIEESKYFPDFIVEDTIVVEVKGYARDRCIEKAKQFISAYPYITYISVGDYIPSDINIDWDNKSKLLEVIEDDMVW